MARLYTYGDVLGVSQQNKWLPGQFADAWGVNLNAPAVKATSLEIEYGEVVGISGGGINSNAYTIARVTEQTTDFAVVVRTTDGAISMEDEWIEAPRTHTPISVYPIDSANHYTIAVPLVDGETPTVGSAVYVSYNTDEEGAVRTDNTNGTALTGWVFASTKYQPTDSDDYCVLIRQSV